MNSCNHNFAVKLRKPIKLGKILKINHCLIMRLMFLLFCGLFPIYRTVSPQICFISEIFRQQNTLLKWTWTKQRPSSHIIFYWRKNYNINLILLWWFWSTGCRLLNLFAYAWRNGGKVAQFVKIVTILVPKTKLFWSTLST